MTEGMMGRTSDTRMYNPHSESSHMYRENHEEESTRTGYEDPRDADAKADRRQKKKEAEEKEDRKIRHIKIRRHHMGLGEKESPDEMPEEEFKFKPRESPSEPTIPAGAGGFLTSLAAQAKGPGAAAGQMVQMSEPMEHAWSTLLKQRYTRDRDETMGEESFLERIETDLSRGMKPSSRKELDKRSFYGNMTVEEANEFNRMTEAERQEKYGLGPSPPIAPNKNPQPARNLGSFHRDDDNIPVTDEEKLYAEIFEQMKNASEPMEHAWSELLKASIEELRQEAESLRGARDFPTARRFQSTANMLGQETPGREVAAQAAQVLSPEDEQMPGVLYEEGLQSPDFMDMRQNPEVYDPVQRENFMRLMRQMEKHRRQVAQGQENLEQLRRDDPSKFFSDRMTGRVQTGEPMDYAWSELLKESKRKKEKRRKKEQRAKWRPSTGKFKRPRGGYTGRSGTSARAKLLSRHIKGGRKSGLMLPHLAVEMSHRGVASKQPMSKDPQAYGQYRAYQEQQNILGNVRPQRGARLPSSQIRMPRVPKPRLKPHRIAPIQPPAMRRPHLVRPKMPSMVTMSEDEPVSSDILKAVNRHLLIEMRNEIKQLKEMMKRRDRDSKKKGMGEPDTAGAASTMPKYPGNNPKQTTRPEGATEDETDARTFGLDPIGYLVGRGGNRA